MNSAYVVGLTGGIGSGKSEVSRAFAALGVECADADEVAHAVTAVGAAGHGAVLAAFGAAAQRPDGSLDRAWLRATVFGDPAARLRLERILHPMILAQLDQQLCAWRGAYGILSVPLLLESGNLLPRVKRILVVDCPEDVQVRRVMRRNAMPEAEVRAIMATQVSRADRLARADDIIDNGGPIENLAPQVLRLHRDYLARARLVPTVGSPQNGAQDSDPVADK